MDIPLHPILSLARAGATSRAWDAFLAAGLDQANQPEALTLKGRLLKDRARQAVGAERAALYAQSGAAYRDAASLRPDSYPLINAAAMALFAGDGATAASLARDVLTLIDGDPAQGETPYWREATRAEALLLLGRITEAQASLNAAMERAPQAWEDHASTLRQFAAILKQRGEDARWLDPLRPTPALHYRGILGIAPDDAVAADAIAEAIAGIAPGFAYGALAAGADIIAAEAVVARGAELHIVLPSDPADFCASSVSPFGAAWVARFDALIDAAASLTLCGAGAETTQPGVSLADYCAMGMAAEKASLLETRAMAMRIEPGDRPALGDPWLSSDRALIHVPVAASASAATPPALADGNLGFLLMRAEDDAPLRFGSLVEMLDALPQGDATAALDVQANCDDGDVAALLQNAAPGTLVASMPAAMALMAEGRCRRIEPLGEMESADGVIGVYAVVLTRPD